jgi:hypothetical protein
MYKAKNCDVSIWTSQLLKKTLKQEKGLTIDHEAGVVFGPPKFQRCGCQYSRNHNDGNRNRVQDYERSTKQHLLATLRMYLSIKIRKDSKLCLRTHLKAIKSHITYVSLVTFNKHVTFRFNKQ